MSEKPNPGSEEAIKQGLGSGFFANGDALEK